MLRKSISVWEMQVITDLNYQIFTIIMLNSCSEQLIQTVINGIQRVQIVPTWLSTHRDSYAPTGMHGQTSYHNNLQRSLDYNKHKGSVTSLSAQEAITPLYIIADK